MKTDISTLYEPQSIHCDWQVQMGDLTSGDDLQTAILISLFTDRLTNSDDDLDNSSDRRGWWGDINAQYKIGSRFWLLRRQKLTLKVAQKAEQYAKEALFWLVDDGVVQSIQIEATIRQPDRLYLTITFQRPDRDSKEMLRYYWVWSKNAI